VIRAVVRWLVRLLRRGLPDLPPPVAGDGRAAAEARRRARQKLEATMRQQRHVDDAARLARELRTQNHFGEQIEQALRRRWAA